VVLNGQGPRRNSSKRDDSTQFEDFLGATFISRQDPTIAAGHKPAETFPWGIKGRIGELLDNAVGVPADPLSVIPPNPSSTGCYPRRACRHAMRLVPERDFIEDRRRGWADRLGLRGAQPQPVLKVDPTVSPQKLTSTGRFHPRAWERRARRTYATSIGKAATCAVWR
jgi:hypothetical protein